MDLPTLLKSKFDKLHPFSKFATGDVKAMSIEKYQKVNSIILTGA